MDVSRIEARRSQHVGIHRRAERQMTADTDAECSEASGAIGARLQMIEDGAGVGSRSWRVLWWSSIYCRDRSPPGHRPIPFLQAQTHDRFPGSQRCIHARPAWPRFDESARLPGRFRYRKQFQDICPGLPGGRCASAWVRKGRKFHLFVTDHYHRWIAPFCMLRIAGSSRAPKIDTLLFAMARNYSTQPIEDVNERFWKDDRAC